MLLAQFCFLPLYKDEQLLSSSPQSRTSVSLSSFRGMPEAGVTWSIRLTCAPGVCWDSNCPSLFSAASVGVRWMIGVTEIDKGSAYGNIDHKRKQTD